MMKHGDSRASREVAEPEYLLGTRADELQRLGFQHRVWSEATFALWHRAGLGPGMTVLDLGCGPGFASVDLAYLVRPTGRVIAFDESQRFLDTVKDQCARLALGNVECVRGDVHELALPAGSLCGAYARWLLCFLRDPAKAIERVAQALRPGGCFVILDYFCYEALTLQPRGPAIDRVVEAVVESWRGTGGDLDIGTRAPALLSAAGLEVEHFQLQSRIARPGDVYWEWPRTFFFGYAPRLAEMGLITPSDVRAFEDEWLAREREATGFLCTPPMVEIVARKPK